VNSSRSISTVCDIPTLPKSVHTSFPCPRGPKPAGTVAAARRAPPPRTLPPGQFEWRGDGEEEAEGRDVGVDVILNFNLTNHSYTHPHSPLPTHRALLQMPAVATTTTTALPHAAQQVCGGADRRESDNWLVEPSSPLLSCLCTDCFALTRTNAAGTAPAALHPPPVSAVAAAVAAVSAAALPTALRSRCRRPHSSLVVLAPLPRDDGARGGRTAADAGRRGYGRRCLSRALLGAWYVTAATDGMMNYCLQ
jgi:hypothetical protein